MTFWCFSSFKYLTSRMADMSSPSLNWPTLIFLIATRLSVPASRPKYHITGYFEVGMRVFE